MRAAPHAMRELDEKAPRRLSGRRGANFLIAECGLESELSFPIRIPQLFERCFKLCCIGLFEFRVGEAHGERLRRVVERGGAAAREL